MLRTKNSRILSIWNEKIAYFGVGHGKTADFVDDTQKNWKFWAAEQSSVSSVYRQKKSRISSICARKNVDFVSQLEIANLIVRARKIEFHRTRTEKSTTFLNWARKIANFVDSAKKNLKFHRSFAEKSQNFVNQAQKNLRGSASQKSRISPIGCEKSVNFYNSIIINEIHIFLICSRTHCTEYRTVIP